MKGGFTGKSNDVTAGSAIFDVHDDGGHTVTHSSDFSLDGAPDPRIGFRKDCKYALAVDLDELKSRTGAQTCPMPVGIEVGDFNKEYVWCLKFSVPLGIASLG